jgi:hypothetical protein
LRRSRLVRGDSPAANTGVPADTPQ